VVFFLHVFLPRAAKRFVRELVLLAKDEGEELVHLIAGGESRPPARLHVLHASDQATVAGVRVSRELDDEDALVGK
jgi:hypothetical protein